MTRPEERRPTAGAWRALAWGVTALLLGGIAPPGLAQDAVEGVRVYYIPTIALAEDEETARFAAIIDEAVGRELSRMGLDLVPGATAPDAVAVASQEDAELLVTSSVLVERRQLVMSFRAVDVSTFRVVDADFEATLVGVTVHNRIDEAVAELGSRLEALLNEPREEAAIAPFALSVELLTRPDGTTISLPSGEVLGTIDEGSLTLPFRPYPVGARLLLRKERPGFHPDEETITLTEPRNVVELEPLWKETIWAVDLHTTWGQLPGAGIGVRYFLDPDVWFVGVQNYFYRQISPYEDVAPLGHYDFSAWTGHYLFFDHASVFRMGLGIGLGVVFTRIDGATKPLFTDYYFNLGSLWLEHNTRLWTFFAKVEAKIALGIGNNLLGAGMMSVYNQEGDEDSGGVPAISVGIGRKL